MSKILNPTVSRKKCPDKQKETPDLYMGIKAYLVPPEAIISDFHFGNYWKTWFAADQKIIQGRQYLILRKNN